MKFDLENRVALVTGSGGALGREIALRFALNGADIAVNDMNEDNGMNVVKEIEALGRKAIYMNADVSSIEQMNAMAAKVIETFGKLDILVNNAGVNVGTPDRRKPIHEFMDEDWDRIINVDLNGVYRCSKPFIKHMVQKKYGRIINIGSIAGLVPLRLQCAYVAAKAGVHELTKSMAIELAPHGILVNAIAPGSIMNEGTKSLFYSNHEKSEALLSHIPLHRPGETGEIANVALFLSSDASSYITGVVIPVDGGWTCGYTRDW